jgi:cytochrome c oxidase assembly protein subunit 15
MSAVSAEYPAASRLSAVRLWLWVVLALVVVMVTVGGATRLTGSGLSITEWRPVTGAIPPLGEAAWLAEFARYQQSPQYELLNRGMSLPEFQFIYWWEWGHRQLGRLIGLVYVVGLIWAAASRRVNARVAVVLFGMGLLLGLQGAVGWIMVRSGLEPGMTAVAPIKLTLHLGFACLFLMSLVAMLVRLGAFRPAEATAPGRGRGGAGILLVLILLQILLGGLVAGSKAGLTFNTWPLMDGRLVPSKEALFAVMPWWENFVDNPALVQFNHRLLAYLVAAVTLWHAWSVRGGERAVSRRAAGLLKLVLAQVVLGVATLLYAVPLALGLAHQFLAVVLLGFATRHAVMLLPGRNEHRQPVAASGAQAVA